MARERPRCAPHSLCSAASITIKLSCAPASSARSFCYVWSWPRLSGCPRLPLLQEQQQVDDAVHITTLVAATCCTCSAWKSRGDAPAVRAIAGKSKHGAAGCACGACIVVHCCCNFFVGGVKTTHVALSYTCHLSPPPPQQLALTHHHTPSLCRHTVVALLSFCRSKGQCACRRHGCTRGGGGGSEHPAGCRVRGGGRGGHQSAAGAASQRCATQWQGPHWMDATAPGSGGGRR